MNDNSNDNLILSLISDHGGHGHGYGGYDDYGGHGSYGYDGYGHHVDRYYWNGWFVNYLDIQTKFQWKQQLA